MNRMSVLDAEEFRRLLDGARPVVLDVRWSLADGADADGYAAAHVPGAVFVDLDAQLCGPAGAGGRHPLPDPAALQEVLRGAGIDDGATVAIYDGGDMLAAARAWWTLHWVGLTDVRVLNGGFGAWRAIGAPVTDAATAPAPGGITVRPDASWVLDADGAARLAGAGRLADVRAPERFRGDSEPIDPVAGHIPGAVNLPAGAYMAPDGGFVTGDDLAGVFAATPPDIGVYCGSGVTAARTALAMTAAGLPTPRVYIGSWSGWIAEGRRPVATGDA
ncbi:MAG TPA: sulfurtransferase [Stackebrandtia sp.]|jgi:thiosulfate/3-mercaptopyruvate sulfurtransferase|uniref:sulfurtransferase n=1 Tax=Stackebrandtia sp. TaxID=2023065 RepID=UPI002D475217|nr:sulfurtransferase [Stackebrandtia sp.]HZE41830.1 sulfurtransferase [Stackebrandtia sp.]